MVLWYTGHLKYGYYCTYSPMYLLSTLSFKKPSCYRHTHTHTHRKSLYDIILFVFMFVICLSPPILPQTGIKTPRQGKFYVYYSEPAHSGYFCWTNEQMNEVLPQTCKVPGHRTTTLGPRTSIKMEDKELLLLRPCLSMVAASDSKKREEGYMSTNNWGTAHYF